MARVKGNPILAVPFGFLIILGSLYLTFWNEGRTVKRTKSLKEIQHDHVRLDSAQSVDATNDGKIVFAQAEALTKESLSDPQFGLNINALRLNRSVERYERKESTDSDGNRQVRYEWVSTSSAGFSSYNKQVNSASFGAFQLSSSIIGQVPMNRSISPTSSEFTTTPSVQGRSTQRAADYFYFQQSPSQNTVGDTRVGFRVADVGDLSMFARQRGSQLELIHTGQDEDLVVMLRGLRSPEEVIDAAFRQNTILAWALRGGGLVLCIMGFAMVFAPITYIARFLPGLGFLLEKGIGLVAAVLGFSLWLIVVSISWLFFRPLLSIALLAMVIGSVYYLWKRPRNAESKAAVAAAAVAPPPPPS